MNAFGILWIVAALLALAGLMAGDDLAGANAVLPIICVAVAVAAFGYNALRLPPWARTRELQMEQVAERARALLSADHATQPSPEDAVD